MARANASAMDATRATSELRKKGPDVMALVDYTLLALVLKETQVNLIKA